ncbi:MAG: hypothetical protein NTY86_16260 [Deltaproteobacteria bacterium]|nr:hypothetical protein [Deltaproteobacteria bacterium]
MSSIEKLKSKARSAPQNITFDELCTLFECYEFVDRGGKGSHKAYKRTKLPTAKYPVQEGPNGKAQPYQVRWLMDWVSSNGIERGDED